MSKIILDTDIAIVIFNNVECDSVYFNDVLVWGKESIHVPDEPVRMFDGDYPTVYASVPQLEYRRHNHIVRCNIVNVDTFYEIDFTNPDNDAFNTVANYAPEIMYILQEAMACGDHDLRLKYTAFAEAELIKQGLFIPFTVSGGMRTYSRLSIDFPRVLLFEDSYGQCEESYETYISNVNSIIADSALDEDALQRIDEFKLEYAQSQNDFCEYTDHELRLLWDYGPIETFDIQAIKDLRMLDILKYTVSPLFTKSPFATSLARAMEISEDGLSVRIFLKTGYCWSDNQGRATANLNADDYAAGLQHALDLGNAPFAMRFIQNAAEYARGEVDFSDVGVYVETEDTITYSLSSYVSVEEVLNALETTEFLPLCRCYYEIMGGKFGSDIDDKTNIASINGRYGNNPDSICYLGSFVISNYTDSVSITLQCADGNFNPELEIYLPNQINITQVSCESYLNDNFSMGPNVFVGDFDYVQYYYIPPYDESTAFIEGRGDETTMFVAHINNDTGYSEMTGLYNDYMLDAEFRRAVSRMIPRALINASFLGQNDDSNMIALSNLISTVGIEDSLKEDLDYLSAGTTYAKLVQWYLADGFDGNFDLGTNGMPYDFDGWYSKSKAEDIFNAWAENNGVDATNPASLIFTCSNNLSRLAEAVLECVKQEIEQTTSGYINVTIVMHDNPDIALKNENYFELCRINTLDKLFRANKIN